MTTTRTVAFVGLGNMGGPMAANLVTAGHVVNGFDLALEALEQARHKGVRIAGSPAEAAVDADVVVTMLPGGAHVLDCYRGPNGLLAAAPAGALFVDCSTIDVADAHAAHAAVRATGRRALDAPVSGGVVGAVAGTLTFMVGADDEDFATIEPLLTAMGRRVVHCGPAGAGQAAKICNNMILGATMIAVSEAFVLGEHLGLSHQALFDVASAASGQCWALTTNCPVPGPVPASPANHDYRPGFAGALMAKDLRLAANAIRAGGVAAELGLHAAEMYAAFAENGGANRDFSAVIHTIRDHDTDTVAGEGNAPA
ncbi:3-hydroxyisobutyrate dehydrogenase [Embleya scabrispora]|uniref:3-hydroxyisobutyrate dehydrogenase n=1 Tax=Embleya scabrispora TaxID=159449 RepID=A0A1T3P579_9ACTN|nr:3-hydroxyisobutyrate dehydrogenase [Embleya scabrispora]OPC84111.1 3-hydroxyisobutyrate dehydrogenase [Embleya scabrispora]